MSSSWRSPPPPRPPFIPWPPSPDILLPSEFLPPMQPQPPPQQQPLLPPIPPHLPPLPPHYYQETEFTSIPWLLQVQQQYPSFMFYPPQQLQTTIPLQPQSFANHPYPSFYPPPPPMSPYPTPPPPPPDSPYPTPPPPPPDSPYPTPPPPPPDSPYPGPSPPPPDSPYPTQPPPLPLVPFPLDLTKSFLCKRMYRNILPDITAQLKPMALKKDKHRYTRYDAKIEKLHKPELHFPRNLGIQLDLLDMSVYSPPKGERLHLDPEDEGLLGEDDHVTQSTNFSAKRRARPSDEETSWLLPSEHKVKKQSSPQKQTKKKLRDQELRAQHVVEEYSRENKIERIEATFEACRKKPAQLTNIEFYPLEAQPLLPDSDGDGTRDGVGDIENRHLQTNHQLKFAPSPLSSPPGIADDNINNENEVNARVHATASGRRKRQNKAHYERRKKKKEDNTIKGDDQSSKEKKKEYFQQEQGKTSIEGEDIGGGDSSIVKEKESVQDEQGRQYGEGEDKTEVVEDVSEKTENNDNDDEDEDTSHESDGERKEDNDDENRSKVKVDFSKSKLYQSYNNHVASLLLRNKPKDRGPLTCKQYTKKLKKWDLDKEHPDISMLVKGSPMYGLIRCSYRAVNRVIISAFIERWHQETNTFHMSFGEMGITLDDIQRITGLPIYGKALTGINSSSMEKEKLEEFVERVLGIPSEEVKEEFRFNDSKSVRFKWLRRRLSGKAHDTCTSEQVARGYLLYLLGCTLFQDKSGNKVQIKYLFYLETWARIDEWAWGAAVLAYLYRELGKGSCLATKTMSGYLTLVEAWVYEHFPLLRPHPSLTLKPTMARTEQWKPKSRYNPQYARKKLHETRIQLDSLTTLDVEWTPYRNASESPPEIVWYTGPLMVHDIVELYHPDRVVRQFGHIQDVPRDPIALNRAQKSGKKAISSSSLFVDRSDEFERWPEYVIKPCDRGSQMKEKGECTRAYANWVKANCICRLDFSVDDPLAPEEMFEANGISGDLITPEKEEEDTADGNNYNGSSKGNRKTKNVMKKIQEKTDNMC